MNTERFAHLHNTGSITCCTAHCPQPLSMRQILHKKKIGTKLTRNLRNRNEMKKTKNRHRKKTQNRLQIRALLLLLPALQNFTHHRHKYDLCCLIGHADTWLVAVHQCRHFHVTLNTTREWKRPRLALRIYTCDVAAAAQQAAQAATAIAEQLSSLLLLLGPVYTLRHKCAKYEHCTLSRYTRMYVPTYRHEYISHIWYMYKYTYICDGIIWSQRSANNSGNSGSYGHILAIGIL